MKNLLLASMLMLVSFLVTPFQARAENTAPATTTLAFQGGNLSATLSWVPESPATVGPESKLMVQWTDIAGQPVEINGDFRVTLFMPDMGHGSSPTKIAKLPETGLYRVSKIYFTMPGTWQVRVTFKPADGSEPETQTLTLDLEMP